MSHNNIPYILVPVGFMGVGLAIILWARKVSLKAKDSLAWPCVEGEVAHSAVEPTFKNTYRADVLYRFRVNDNDYSSSVISVVDVSAGFGRAQNIIARYPDGSKVKVYYNPSDPSDSLIEPGTTSGIIFLYLFGVVFFGVGCFLVYMALTGHLKLKS